MQLAMNCCRVEVGSMLILHDPLLRVFWTSFSILTCLPYSSLIILFVSLKHYSCLTIFPKCKSECLHVYVMFLFCLVFAMSLCASVYICFVVTCWERVDLLALVCGV